MQLIELTALRGARTCGVPLIDLGQQASAQLDRSLNDDVDVDVIGVVVLDLGRCGFVNVESPEWTFPRPASTERLRQIGQRLDEERREIMLRRDLGLTKLYNLVNDRLVQGDSDVDRMRDVHREVDDATSAAYGWDDVPLGHGFHVYRQAERWTLSAHARTEILDRLVTENHVRASGDRDSPRFARTGEVPIEDGTLFDR